MKRLDFLKALSIPLIVPFVTKAKPSPDKYKPNPGDIAYYDGKDYHPVSSAHPEGAPTAYFHQPKHIF